MRNIVVMVRTSRGWAKRMAVEDLMELGYVALALLLQEYDPSRAELLTYLYPRLRGAMADELRREARRASLRERRRLEIRVIADSVSPVSEEQIDLGRAIASLHPRDRDMFLRVQAGYEVQEAGRAWGVSKTRASRIVHRAECIVRDHCR